MTHAQAREIALQVFYDQEAAHRVARELDVYVQPMLEGGYYLYRYADTDHRRFAMFEDGGFRPFRRSHR